ncbi:MAG: thioesterase family protein [Sediminibacterium sp.]|nr:thioesterase family protein [Sediminibacterium sp.]MDP3665949.1 thioesterase family protein [Sediminibacterium sp.]
MPNIFHFSTTLLIRVTDLNYGGHVGNDTFLSLIQEARQQFLKSHGYEELSIAGVGLIMADVAIEFKKELSYGEAVKISVAAADFNKLGFDLFYKLEVLNGTETHLAGKAKTGMLCFNYVQKKKVSVPEEVIKKLSGVPYPPALFSL